jgi:hypothetical protein
MKGLKETLLNFIIKAFVFNVNSKRSEDDKSTIKTYSLNGVDVLSRETFDDNTTKTKGNYKSIVKSFLSVIVEHTDESQKAIISDLNGLLDSVGGEQDRDKDNILNNDFKLYYYQNEFMLDNIGVSVKVMSESDEYKKAKNLLANDVELLNLAKSERLAYMNREGIDYSKKGYIGKQCKEDKMLYKARLRKVFNKVIDLAS